MTLVLPMAFGLSRTTNQVNALENHGEEAACETYWIDELPTFKGSATQSASGVITNQAEGTYLFDYSLSNIKVKANYTFSSISTVTWFSINLGATYSDNPTYPLGTKGYAFVFYTNGMYALRKNGTDLIAETWGAVALTEDTPFTFTVSSQSCADGAVHLSATVNQTHVFDYYDVASPITSGCVGGETCWLYHTISGNSVESPMPVINVFDADFAVSGGTVAVTSVDEDDRTIVTSASATSGYSGVAFRHQMSHTKYAVRTQVTPLSDSTTIILQLGGINGDINENNRAIGNPTLYDDLWGWRNPGYLLYLFTSGQIFLSRRDYEHYMDYVWGTPMAKNSTYDLEFGITQFSFGDLITLKVNGVKSYRYFDVKKDSYSEGELPPVEIPHFTGTLFDSKTSFSRYCGFYTLTSSAKFEFNHPEVAKKTVLSKDLGAPVIHGGSTVLHDGEINNLVPYDIVGYNINSTSIDLTFNVNLSTLGDGNTSFAFFFNYVGSTVDKQYSANWSTHGYILSAYKNSMFGITKNNQILALGWAFGSPEFAVNTNYLVRVGEELLVDGSVHIFCSINGTDVLNFIDGINPINVPGWFAVDSSGVGGSVTQVGNDRPALTVSADAIESNETVTLGYLNPQPGDVVNYYINEEESTVSASIVNGVMVPGGAGTVSVYAVVNGVASESVSITVTEETKALLSISNDKIVVGSTTAILSGSLSDSTPIESVSFLVEPITGEAIIDGETGVLTGVKAGTVKVYAVVNNIQSDPQIVYINPIVYIKNATAFALGGKRVLEYAANCELPDEEITAEYEVMDGFDNCSYDASTHTITGTKLGVVRLRVKVTGQTFAATSGVVDVSVEKPVVVIATEFKDMFVGHSQLIDASINHHEVEVISQKVIVEQGAECVQINGLNVKAIKAGTVKFHVEMNNIKSVTKTFVISEIEGVIEASNMRINSTQELHVIFNDPAVTVTSVTYSIIKGNELATIEGSTLTAGGTYGSITVQALVNSIITLTKVIHIIGDVDILVNFDEESPIIVGKSYIISYEYYADDEVNSVELVFSKKGIFNVKEETIEIDGKIKKIFIVTPRFKGHSTVSISVNGKKSREINLVVEYDEEGLKKKRMITWIVVGSVAGASLIAGGVTFLVIRKKKQHKKEKAQ